MPRVSPIHSEVGSRPTPLYRKETSTVESTLVAHTEHTSTHPPDCLCFQEISQRGMSYPFVWNNVCMYIRVYVRRCITAEHEEMMILYQLHDPGLCFQLENWSFACRAQWMCTLQESEWAREAMMCRRMKPNRNWVIIQETEGWLTVWIGGPGELHLVFLLQRQWLGGGSVQQGGLLHPCVVPLHVRRCVRD